VTSDDCQAFCGGALVGPATVLTAAHCFFDAPDPGVRNPSVRAVLGYAGPVNTPQDPGNIVGGCKLKGMYKIRSVQKPVHYEHVVGYDLALVTLDDSSGCPGVTPVKVAALGYNLSSWVVSEKPWSLLGFGATDGESRKPSPHLRLLEMPIAAVGSADDKCNLDAPAQARVPSLICTPEFPHEEQGASGDSGGPWTLFDSALAARIYAAVQSSGQVNSQGDHFGYLINPAWFQDWIAHHILGTDPCLSDPAPGRSSFFYGYVENSTDQYCVFGDCDACSNKEVVTPGHVRAGSQPRVEGCLNWKVGRSAAEEPKDASTPTSLPWSATLAILAATTFAGGMP